MFGSKTVMEPLDNGHGQNDLAILMRLENAEDSIGYVPDDGGFLLNINAYLVYLVVFFDFFFMGGCYYPPPLYVDYQHLA